MNTPSIRYDESGNIFVGNEIFRASDRLQAAYLASAVRAVVREAYEEGREEGRNAARWRLGFLVNKHSTWIGAHYSPHNKRWCINLLPCITFWITKPGGNTP